MDDYEERDEIVPAEPLAEEVLSKEHLLDSILDTVYAKRELFEANRKKRKKDDKKRRKSKKDKELGRYGDYLDNYDILYPNSFDPFLHQQKRFREGNVVPEALDMNLYYDSGFFFGRKDEPNGFVGKPAHMDGHILGLGIPGSGKTQALVIPTMMTWRGSQIIVDVKGDLAKYWYSLNRHTGKKLKLFDPTAPTGGSCGYDPFAAMRQGGLSHVDGNARILALALLPTPPSVKDPIWIQAAQSFLTGAIIYYFSIGFSFVETMVAIQHSSVAELIDDIKDGDIIAAQFYMSKLADVQEKVIGNIGMELSKLAALVTDPALLNVFCADDECRQIDWAELNSATEQHDIILVFPEADMERWEPLMQLMLNQLAKSLEQRPPRTYKEDEASPVLVMLDEFPRLGRISAIKNGLATLRSRGITFALFVQSFADLDETYGSTAARVIADLCAYKIVLKIADVPSQEYFSKATGTTESTIRGVSVTHDPISGRVSGYGRNINETRESILYPHEFLTNEDVVVINPHNGFFRLEKTLFVQHWRLFLSQQLLQNPGHVAQTPLTYDYKP